MRALSLDVGDRYIGVAATDHSDPIAYRYTTLDRTAQDPFVELPRIVASEAVDTVVVGVPYHVEDGSETEQTKKTRHFIATLQRALGDTVRIVEMDETLTSREAKRTLAAEDADSSQEHAEAARIMLQEYISQGI